MNHSRMQQMIVFTAFAFAIVLLFQIPVNIIKRETVSSFLGLSLGATTQRGDISSDNIVKSDIENDNLFDSLVLDAKAALIMEYRTNNVLFEKNATSSFSIASITKLMTALAARDIFENQRKTPFAISIKMPLEAIEQEGDLGFTAGEEFFSGDLINAMLVSSSNDAAYAIALHAGGFLVDSEGYGGRDNLFDPLDAFIAYMNTKAHTLSLAGTTFFNPTGLDRDEEKKIPGAISTLHDIASLVFYIMNTYPDMLLPTAQENLTVWSIDGKEHIFHNSNPLASSLPGLLISKTGFTDSAGGNAVIVVDLGFGNPVFIGVFGSTYEGRFTDIMKLYDAAKGYYAAQ